VADALNNKIRKIVITSGVVSSFTGTANTAGASGAADGAATLATFHSPGSITSDGTNLYVADTANYKIRKIVIATGAVSSLTGAANTAGAAGAADGPGSAATFNITYGITTDGTNVYVADTSNQKIRKIVIATGVVSSFTGTANTAGTSGAADGAATLATFYNPYGLTTDGTNLYVADSSNNKIRQIVIASGAVTTFAGSAPGADGTGATGRFNHPANITTDGTNLYVADMNNNKIRKIVIASGVVTTLAGSPANAAGTADGAGSTATFDTPSGITTDGTNLYVADSNNHKIRKIVIASGMVSSLTGTANTAGAAGAADGAGSTATFDTPSGITTDGTNLYVADSNNHKIRKIVIASGMVSSLTGTANTAGAAGAADGAGSTATFDTPSGITTDGTNLYVADSNNHKIRNIVIASGMVSSLTGTANTAGAAGAADGAGSAATFSYPTDLTTDGTSLFVADNNNSTIRKIQ
jgi:sugar lactone lactonase YvrE